MEWMLMPLKRYADFSGRSRRKEYWMFTLFNIILFTVLFLLAGLMGGFNPDSPALLTGLGWVVVGIPALAMIIPGIAVTVRRFHDQDKSGWFYLLSFIPYIGGIIVLVFMFLEGTQGPNRFGPDPKQSIDNVFN